VYGRDYGFERAMDNLGAIGGRCWLSPWSLVQRATDLFDHGHSQTAATQLTLVLHVLYNVAATVISIPAGQHGDRFNPIRVLIAGAVCFAAGYAVFAAGPRQRWLLARGFIPAGLGISCGEIAGPRCPRPQHSSSSPQP
jgi:MFS family permease